MKIIAAKTFPGTKDESALDLAAAWLNEQCGTKLEPLALVIKGDAARVVMAGTDGGAIVLVPVLHATAPAKK